MRTWFFTRYPKRRGAIIAEFGITSGMLVMLLLGLIEFGGFINGVQTVHEAARQGARCAARERTLSITPVRDRVNFVVGLYFVGIQTDQLLVQVEDASGNVLVGPQAVTRGDPVAVRVRLPYSKVSSFAGVLALGGSNLEARAVMRRE